MSALTPPAQVRTAKSEIMASAKKLLEGMKSRDKLNLQDAISLGKLIVRLKAECAAGDYLPSLQKIGLSRQRAAEFRRFADMTPAELKGCESIADARRAVEVVADEQENTGPSQEGMSTGGHTGHAGSANGTPKLVPDLATWPAGFSPRILPRVEALPEWKQYSLLASLNLGRNIVQALGEVEDMEPPSEPETEQPAGEDAADVASAGTSSPSASVTPDAPSGSGEAHTVKCPTCRGKGTVPEVKATSLKFKAPTVEEVKAYCEERKNAVDADTFVDFYASKGWKVGKEGMKDWKASVRTWEKNRGSSNGYAGKTPQRQNDRFVGPGEPVEPD